MTTTNAERVRLGALLTGAIALGAGGVATAGKLIDSSDIKDGSIQTRDLSKSTKKALGLRDSLLVSTIPYLPPSTTSYVAPGGSNEEGMVVPEAATMVVPNLPARGFLIRSLNMRSTDAKASSGLSAKVKLFRNQSTTGLTCPISGPSTECFDNGSVKAKPGDRFSLEVENQSKGFASVSVTLSLRAR